MAHYKLFCSFSGPVSKEVKDMAWYTWERAMSKILTVNSRGRIMNRKQLVRTEIFQLTHGRKHWVRNSAVG